MTKDEQRKEIERMLKGCPDILTPAKVVNWTPFGRNRVYGLLKSGELRSFSYCGKYVVAKLDLIDYLVEHCDDETDRTFRIDNNGGSNDE